MPQRAETINRRDFNKMGDAGRQELREIVERFSARFFAKDGGICEEFAPDAILAGSEVGDLAFGRDAVLGHLRVVMNRPYAIRWDWSRLDTGVIGEAGWAFADGDAVIDQDGAERRMRYRLSAVFAREDGAWRWKLFHGSEPTP